MNSVPRSNMILCGRGYLVNRVNYSMFETLAEVFPVIAAFSNHSVIVSIIVTHQSLRSFLPLRLIFYGPMRSTHRVSWAFTLASLDGSFP